MDKKIIELSLTEIQAVVGGAKAVASASINVTAPAMHRPTAQAIQPSRYETLLARR